MKSYYTFLLIAFLSLQSFSQALKTELTKDADTYLDHFTNKNFDGILDYIYPKVFEMASRDQMKQGMEQMLNGEEMKIDFLSNDVTEVSEIINNSGKDFSLVSFDSDMKMIFLDGEYSSKEEKEGFLNFMKGTMEMQFGEGNVKEEIDTMSLIVTVSGEMFAIKDPEYKGWKFISNDDSMKQFIQAIVPNNVKDKLLKEKK